MFYAYIISMNIDFTQSDVVIKSYFRLKVEYESWLGIEAVLSKVFQLTILFLLGTSLPFTYEPDDEIYSCKNRFRKTGNFDFDFG